METQKTKVVGTAVLAAIILAVGGYLLGQQITEKQAVQESQNLKTLVDIAFPPPPQEMYRLTGTVKGIYGATIQLEINDPDDYLPHPDGSPRRTQTRSAIVSGNTAFKLIDYTNLDNQGNPAVTQIQLSDIKVGEVITVSSDQNIRDAEKFDVTTVEVIRY